MSLLKLLSWLFGPLGVPRVVSVSAWLPPPRRLTLLTTGMKLEGAIWFRANVGPLLRMRTLESR